MSHRLRVDHVVLCQALTSNTALITALVGPEGEYATRAEYTAIVVCFGPVQPYANILQAEKQRVAALQNQCAKVGLPVPAETYQGQVIARYDKAFWKARDKAGLGRAWCSTRCGTLSSRV